MRRFPIRWRLTAWYALFFVVSFLLLGVALYLGLRIILFDTFREDVTTETNLALAGVHTQAGQLFLDPATAAALNDEEHFLQLYDASGRFVTGTGRTDTGTQPSPGQINAGLRGAGTLRIEAIN